MVIYILFTSESNTRSGRTTRKDDMSGAKQRLEETPH